MISSRAAGCFPPAWAGGRLGDANNDLVRAHVATRRRRCVSCVFGRPPKRNGRVPPSRLHHRLGYRRAGRSFVARNPPTQLLGDTLDSLVCMRAPEAGPGHSAEAYHCHAAFPPRGSMASMPPWRPRQLSGHTFRFPPHAHTPVPCTGCSSAQCGQSTRMFTHASETQRSHVVILIVFHSLQSDGRRKP
jgi:hypothetical protein